MRFSGGTLHQSPQTRHEGSRDPAPGALQIIRSGGVRVLTNDTRLASSPGVSSARNTIETAFLLRRNDIWSATLNVLLDRDQWASMLQERGIQCMKRSYEKVRPLPRKAGIRCPLP